MTQSDGTRCKSPAITVVSACYNHGKYVSEMIHSVLAQTFPDFELIIVNDGSTDNSREMLDAVQDERVRVLHTPNRGPSLARNLAIEKARAPIIFNLDADDKIAPTLLEKARKVFMTNPEAGIVTCEVRFFGAKSGPFLLPPFSIEAMLRNNLIHSTAFFRKEDWRRAGGYSDRLPFGPEDYDFYLSILELGVKVHRIPEELSFYRIHPLTVCYRSRTRKKNRNQMIKAWLVLYERHSALFSQYPRERERMERLKRKWEMESSFTKGWKQLLHYLLYLKHRMTVGCC